MSTSSVHDSQSCLRCIYGGDMKLYTTHTLRNPKRKIWKYHNEKDGIFCGEFTWADKIDQATRNDSRVGEMLESNSVRLKHQLMGSSEKLDIFQDKIVECLRCLEMTSTSCCRIL